MRENCALACSKRLINGKEVRLEAKWFQIAVDLTRLGKPTKTWNRWKKFAGSPIITAIPNLSVVVLLTYYSHYVAGLDGLKSRVKRAYQNQKAYWGWPSSRSCWNGVMSVKYTGEYWS